MALVYLGQCAVIVDDYDQAIRFVVDPLGFQLVADVSSITNETRPCT